MTKCEYCGGEIGFLSGRYKWINKENDFALHNKCLKEYYKKLPDMIKEEENWYDKFQQIDFKTLSQSERNKIFDDYLKSNSHLGRGSSKIPKEWEISWCEHYIEVVKKADYPGKEKNLKEAIEKLKQLKNEDVK
jgi:hypothetical protein